MTDPVPGHTPATTWRTEVETVFGETIVSSATLAGGDLSETQEVVLADGTRMAVKMGRQVGAEARMLEAMRIAGADVPRVLHAGGALLCLEWIDAGPPGAAGWSGLGRALSGLHACAGGSYGWPEHHAFGPVEIDNGMRAAWPDFWAEARLLPCVPHLDPAAGARLESLVRELHDRLPARPAAAFLHGDLWSGNVLFAEDRTTMIDPACYYGDAEVDLAMLALFGTPPPTFDEAYGPLSDGWEARRPIYQLWPALVHLRLFGTSYAGMVDRLLAEAGV